METMKQSQDIACLSVETQQRIQVVNTNFNSLSSSVFESLQLEMSETKENIDEMGNTWVEQIQTDLCQLQPVNEHDWVKTLCGVVVGCGVPPHLAVRLYLLHS